MGVAISSREELEVWLEDKPREWAQVIALRAALRVLPFACEPAAFSGRIVDPRLPLAVFRASAISSGAAKIPLDDIAAYAAAAARAASAARAAAADAARAASAARAAYAAADAVRVAASTARASAAARAAFAADTASAASAAFAVWQSIVVDCDRLDHGAVVGAVIEAPLWPNGLLPEALAPIWTRASAWLDANPPDGFPTWREWYERKLQGKRFEFEGFNEAAEREFFDRLFAQDNSWWNRKPEAVNAEIAGWVEELRQPSTPNVDFFISYSTANEAAAREVAAILDNLGKTYIVQFRDFAQQNFVNAMNEGLAQAERLIALYSPEYVASHHCMAEWGVFYNRDPSSAQRRIVAFKLEDVDLKPLMKPIVFCDLSRLTGAARQAAIREWIIWEPAPPTRAQVEQVVTATLSPQIVATEDGKLDTQPNPVLDQPEYPAELAQALKALGMVLDVVLEETSNLPRPMQKALDGYDQEFTANGAKSSWGGLDRLMTIIAGGLAKMAEAELAEGLKEALEQLIAAHGACMAALKNADKQLRELGAIPLDGADQSRIKELVDRLKDFFKRLRDLGLTSKSLDQHVDNLVEQGRDFAFEAGEPDADQRPHARRQFLLYAGGFGLAALNALGSMASISTVPLAQEAVEAGQAMVEVFFRMIGL